MALARRRAGRYQEPITAAAPVFAYRNEAYTGPGAPAPVVDVQLLSFDDPASPSGAAARAQAFRSNTTASLLSLFGNTAASAGAVNPTYDQLQINADRQGAVMGLC